MDKNYTEVTIAGKTYTLGGYEDAEYRSRLPLISTPASVICIRCPAFFVSRRMTRT